MYKNALNLPQNSLKASVHFPKTGGGAKFLKFIRQGVFVQNIEACRSCAIPYLGFINLCCDSLARFKTTNRKFSWSKITLHTVQLELVTVQVQLEKNHFTYGSARACDSSAIFKTINAQFSKKLFTQQTVQLHTFKSTNIPVN